jgi:hypothetical protein
MKNVISFLLIITISLIHAQKTTLNVSESVEYKDKEKALTILTIHTTKNGLTGMVRESKKNLLFDVFDKSLKKKHSRVVESSKIQDNKGNTYYLPYFGTYQNETFIMMSSGRKKRQFMILK